LLEYVAMSRANSKEKLPQLRLRRVQQLNGGIFISIHSRSSMLQVINHAAGCQPQTHNKQQNCSVINEQFGKWKSQPHTHTQHMMCRRNSRFGIAFQEKWASQIILHFWKREKKHSWRGWCMYGRRVGYDCSSFFHMCAPSAIWFAFAWERFGCEIADTASAQVE